MPTALPSDFAVVEVYDARTGEWFEGVGAELQVGDSYLDGGHLMRVTEVGVEARGMAAASDLAEADATWVAEAAHRVPGGDDWVLVLGDDDEALLAHAEALADLASKLPREAREGDDGIRLDDPEFLREAMGDVTQLLVPRLLGGSGGEG